MTGAQLSTVDTTLVSRLEKTNRETHVRQINDFAVLSSPWRPFVFLDKEDCSPKSWKDKLEKKDECGIGCLSPWKKTDREDLPPGRILLGGPALCCPFIPGALQAVSSPCQPCSSEARVLKALSPGSAVMAGVCCGPSALQGHVSQRLSFEWAVRGKNSGNGWVTREPSLQNSFWSASSLTTSPETAPVLPERSSPQAIHCLSWSLSHST